MLSIDFNKSSISWDGESKGIFKLESIITYINDSNKKILYGLANSVLAGNVYSQKNLIKKPFYLFQVYGNSKTQKIFRTDLSINNYNKLELFFKRKRMKDNKLSKIFTKFNLNIKKQKTKRMFSIKDIYNNSDTNNFVAKIKFIDFLNLNFEIEFPINHINLMKSQKKWHIETGPILFPYVFKENKFKLLPSFIMFNSFNHADVFYDYPFGLRNKNKSQLKKITCKIKLYSPENNK